MSNAGAWVAGLDGARAGWFAWLWNPETGEARHRLLDRFDQVLALPERPAMVGVDMPIELLDGAKRSGRKADRRWRMPATIGRRWPLIAQARPIASASPARASTSSPS